MNSFDDWTQIIAKYLKSESDPLGCLAKHNHEGDAAQAAFTRSVLDRFLPETYGVGAGQIMDSKGNMSKKIDVIVYRRDFPRLDLPGSCNVYLYESVIATFEVTSKLVKKTFFEALDSCASLSELEPGINQKALASLAAKNQFTLNDNKQFVHPDPVRTARFHLIGRPLSFIYAFSGYKSSTGMMTETLEAWMRERKNKHKPVSMKSLPVVVATQGCFAWRNSAPFSAGKNCLMGVGKDDAPVRLIIFQMLYEFSRKLHATAGTYGLKPALSGYLKQVPPPQVDQYFGIASNPLAGDTLAFKPSVKQKATVKKPVVPAAAKLAAKLNDAQKTPATLDQQPEAVDAPFPQPTADLIPQLDPNPPEYDQVETETPLPALSMEEDSPPISISTAAAAIVDTMLEPKKKPANIPIPGSVDPEQCSETPKAKPDPVKAIDSARSFLETVRMRVAEPQPVVNPGTNGSTPSASDGFVDTAKRKMAAPEPFPELQPESEPEPEPFTSTVPQ